VQGAHHRARHVAEEDLILGFGERSTRTPSYRAALPSEPDQTHHNRVAVISTMMRVEALVEPLNILLEGGGPARWAATHGLIACTADGVGPARHDPSLVLAPEQSLSLHTCDAIPGPGWMAIQHSAEKPEFSRPPRVPHPYRRISAGSTIRPPPSSLHAGHSIVMSLDQAPLGLPPDSMVSCRSSP